jgi:putative chitinase
MSRSLAAACALIAAGIGLAALAPPRGGCTDTYRVVRGDTLSVIARRCRSSVAAIARASGIANPNLILVGQRLTIPGAGGASLARSPSAYSPAARAARGAAIAYRFERGDTLYSLARWSRVSLPSLLAANPGVDPRRIEIGDIIRLPGGAARPRLARVRERGPAPAPRAVYPAAAAEPASRADEVEDPRRGPMGM